MQLVLEKVRDDRANLGQVLGKAGVGRANLGQDPCSIAVIYSDCFTALERVAAVKPGSEEVVKKMIDSSIALQQLGVDVHLHWVPGHRNVPGNEVDRSCSQEGSTACPISRWIKRLNKSLTIRR